MVRTRDAGIVVLSLGHIHLIEQETTEGTEISEAVEANVCFGARISLKAGSAERVWRAGKSMFSLRSLRFLLFTILSLAVSTASLLMLCPAQAHAQGGVPLWLPIVSTDWEMAMMAGPTPVSICKPRPMYSAPG